MTTRALPVSPYPLTPDQLAALKQAKAAMAVDYLIKPVPAHPMSSTPILAFEPPQVIGDHAYLRPGWSVDNVQAALRAVLEHPEHPAITLVLDQLRALMGPEVKEVRDDPGERTGAGQADQPVVAFR